MLLIKREDPPSRHGTITWLESWTLEIEGGLSNSMYSLF